MNDLWDSINNPFLSISKDRNELEQKFEYLLNNFGFQKATAIARNVLNHHVPMFHLLFIFWRFISFNFFVFFLLNSLLNPVLFCCLYQNRITCTNKCWICNSMGMGRGKGGGGVSLPKKKHVYLKLLQQMQFGKIVRKRLWVQLMEMLLHYSGPQFASCKLKLNLIIL